MILVHVFLILSIVCYICFLFHSYFMLLFFQISGRTWTRWHLREVSSSRRSRRSIGKNTQWFETFFLLIDSVIEQTLTFKYIEKALHPLKMWRKSSKVRYKLTEKFYLPLSWSTVGKDIYHDCFTSQCTLRNFLCFRSLKRLRLEH